MKRWLLAIALWLTSALALAAININTATKDELDALPGIGPVKAQAIVDYRKAHGPFKSIDDLKKVDGIGDATFEKIKGEVTLTGASKGAKAAPTAKPVEAKAAAAPAHAAKAADAKAAATPAPATTAPATKATATPAPATAAPATKATATPAPATPAPAAKVADPKAAPAAAPATKTTDAKPKS